ncbi:hypothetical protein D9M68_886410 [compost metagenome]
MRLHFLLEVLLELEDAQLQLGDLIARAPDFGDVLRQRGIQFGRVALQFEHAVACDIAFGGEAADTFELLVEKLDLRIA